MSGSEPWPFPSILDQFTCPVFIPKHSAPNTRATILCARPRGFFCSVCAPGNTPPFRDFCTMTGTCTELRSYSVAAHGASRRGGGCRSIAARRWRDEEKQRREDIRAADWLISRSSSSTSPLCA
ncbi:hypothetical protein XENOCAPTIV_015693 [Xenoophorus captivus]|uniref:Uncharacterized protein n=1 Tax=Xenoophorus captivus TaxID=1517983 RepID=A0ABV0S775_9TELE